MGIFHYPKQKLCAHYIVLFFFLKEHRQEKQKILSFLSAPESKLQDLHGYQWGLSVGYHGHQWGSHF